MKRIYLHIGAEKTGTTTIQGFMSANREKLAEMGYLYPMAPGKSNHRSIALYAMKDGRYDSLRKSFDINDEESLDKFRSGFLRDFRSEMNNSTARNVVLSNEHCHSRLRDVCEIQSVKDLLADYSSDIRVIIYIRRQDMLAVSLYSTAVKVGEKKDFSFDNMYDEYYYDFHQVYNNWANVFGGDNITVRVFEKNKLECNDLIHDFLKCIGLEFRDEFVTIKPDNEGLAENAVNYLRILNGIMPNKIRGVLNNKRQYIVNKISERFPGRGVTPDRGSAMKYYERFRLSNELLREELRFKENLFIEDFSMYKEVAGAVGYQIDEITEYLVRNLVNELFDARLQLALTDAKIKFETGDYKQARSALVDALYYSPSDHRANYYFARLCYELGHIYAAKKHIDLAVKDVPDNIEYTTLQSVINFSVV